MSMPSFNLGWYSHGHAKRTPYEGNGPYRFMGIVTSTKEILRHLYRPTGIGPGLKELLQDLKERGIERVSCSATTIVRWKGPIEEMFPFPISKECMVISKEISFPAASQRRSEITGDFKKVYKAENKEKGKRKLPRIPG